MAVQVDLAIFGFHSGFSSGTVDWTIQAMSQEACFGSLLEPIWQETVANGETCASFYTFVVILLSANRIFGSKSHKNRES